MTRPIKFRAWDGEKMWDWQPLKEKQQYLSFLDDETSSWQLMQFTGLRDKNRQEIYEGDVIQGQAGDNEPITFQDGAFCWQGVSLSEWHIELWEVIGNIYENPGLLKVEPTHQN
jgi:YopX protein